MPFTSKLLSSFWRENSNVVEITKKTLTSETNLPVIGCQVLLVDRSKNVSGKIEYNAQCGNLGNLLSPTVIFQKLREFKVCIYSEQTGKPKLEYTMLKCQDVSTTQI